MLSRSNASFVLFCFSGIVLGFIISIFLQRIEFNWILGYVKTLISKNISRGNGTSLALLTLVADLGKDRRAFSVAVLPKKEVGDTNSCKHTFY